MSFSATRLTCFALLSALEEDLRTEIEAVAARAQITDLLGADRAKRVQERRSRDRGAPTTDSVAALLPYLDFADAFDLLLIFSRDLPTTLGDQLASLKPKKDLLVAIRNRVAHSRPMEIDDLPCLLDATQDLTNKPGGHWALLTETADRLANDPSHVLSLTVSLITDLDVAPQNNLPVPDFDETGFFGRKLQRERVKRAIRGAYPVVSILGDGGIGKTSLALKIAYELLDDPKQPFDAFVWVTAKATVLTVSEIRRINDAVQDSLGLFAEAVQELGGDATGDATSELLSYLETFKVLLILDNMETVLDQRLRDFLLELPLGSKVMVTSRIGLGIENPVQLAPLTDDESTNLLRAVARIRQVPLLQELPQERVAELARAMNGHPAYIKWFVSGVQSGRRPEDLLSDNSLLLDFCMSNVYEYLSEQARAVLRSLQALPGPRAQAELAYVNDCSAKQIQSALLELITTNFVQMQSLSPTQLLETTYQLSDFGKQYLQTAHPVPADEQAWLIDRQQGLAELGYSLRAENSASPYDPHTVDIRGSGDFHVAKLLRDAVRAATQTRDTDHALALCREAQVLSPTYHEAWRVEAFIHDLRGDIASAQASYERADELATGAGPLNYFYGTFLVRSGSNPTQGLRRLQRSVAAGDADISVLAEIAATHVGLKDWDSALAIALHAAAVGGPEPRETARVFQYGLTAVARGGRHLFRSGATSHSLELIEEALPLCDAATSGPFVTDMGFDRILQIRELCEQISTGTPEEYEARKAASFAQRLDLFLGRQNPLRGTRRLGVVKTLVQDKFFGFVRVGSRDYFFHIRDLPNQDDWSDLREGTTIAFRPIETHPRGARAGEPAVLD